MSFKKAILIVLCCVGWLIFPLNVTAEQAIQVGYTKDTVTIHEKAQLDSKEVGILHFNSIIAYKEIEDSEFLEVVYADADNYGFVERQHIVEESCDKKILNVPANKGVKNWMPYNIFSKASSQYALQKIAETDSEGLRTVKDRYCVALGSYFTSSIGQYFDLVLANGKIIPCVLADAKADIHTDAMNIFSRSGCCSEFVVDSKSILSPVKFSGDMSKNREEWESPVVSVIVYDKNALTDE